MIVFLVKNMLKFVSTDLGLSKFNDAALNRNRKQFISLLLEIAFTTKYISWQSELDIFQSRLIKF